MHNNMKIIKKFQLLFILLFSVIASADYLIIPLDEDLKMPLPLPYDGKEYSENNIKTFIDNTIAESKQPIIIFGGNWCADCRILDGTFELPTVKEFMQAKYRILHIDVGRYERNMHLFSFFGIPKEEGVPRVLVFDKQKNLLNAPSSKEWTTARDRKKQEIFNYFQDLVAD